MDTRQRIFEAISAERDRQDAKFGVCDHPMVPAVGVDGSARGHLTCVALGITHESLARQESERRFAAGCGTFSDIIKEEFAEFVEACAVDGETSDHAREEAVQNAAVWVAIIEAIDRKRATRAAESVGFPVRDVVGLQPVAGSDDVFLVTLSCGHRRSTRQRHVRYRCFQCSSDGQGAAKDGAR